MTETTTKVNGANGAAGAFVATGVNGAAGTKDAANGNRRNGENVVKGCN
ncbi:hypothetical protein [Bifidobacterium sp. ESL0745]|nr:hypothetical protein [Bifidobacterium sp. ESL0745]MDF7665680.1 hypothetical protein [Bifidobacterium sp. ESL0745]